MVDGFGEGKERGGGEAEDGEEVGRNWAMIRESRGARKEEERG